MERHVVAVYPGSFDPVTFGHIDIIKRSALLYDEVIVAVLKNIEKTGLFTTEERVALLKEATKDIENVRVESFDGLLVDYVKQTGANVAVRGLRAVTDFESELQLCQLNKIVYPEMETVFLTAAQEYGYLSSSKVREIASFGGPVHPFVPDYVEKALREKYKGAYDDKD